jgi:hypothetical protein
MSALLSSGVMAGRIALMKSSRPISSFDLPRPISRSTSTSRSVSEPSDGGRWPGAGLRTNSSINLLVMLGASSSSPREAIRTAAISWSRGGPFNMKPGRAAPERVIEDVLVAVEGREHDDVRMRVGGASRGVASSPQGVRQAG